MAMAAVLKTAGWKRPVSSSLTTSANILNQSTTVFNTQSYIFFLREWLSNFALSPFTTTVPTETSYISFTFPTVEHYFMYMKAAVFKDWEVAEQILLVPGNRPLEAKHKGRQVRNYDESVWAGIRYQIMLEGNYQKYTQNDDFKLKLMNTGCKILVEANPVDGIWGVALDARDSRITDPCNWKGLNLLGLVLMEVRAMLVAQEETP